MQNYAVLYYGLIWKVNRNSWTFRDTFARESLKITQNEWIWISILLPRTVRTQTNNTEIYEFWKGSKPNHVRFQSLISLSQSSPSLPHDLHSKFTFSFNYCEYVLLTVLLLLVMLLFKLALCDLKLVFFLFCRSIRNEDECTSAASIMAWTTGAHIAHKSVFLAQTVI